MLGEGLNMKAAIALLVATSLLAACSHTEVERQQATSVVGVTPTNPQGYFPGHPPTSAESVDNTPMFFSPRTPEEVAADEELAQRIVGIWVLDPQSDWHEYQAINIRPDSSFTATIKRNKQLPGAWRVDRRVLFLGKPNASTPLDYPGFHVVYLVDDHHLVCGIGMDVLGRMRFIK